MCQRRAKPPPTSAARSRSASAGGLGLRGREPEVLRLGERRVHERERDLHEGKRPAELLAPGAERLRDPGAEARARRRSRATCRSGSRGPRAARGWRGDRRAGSGSAGRRPGPRATPAPPSRPPAAAAPRRSGSSRGGRPRRPSRGASRPGGAAAGRRPRARSRPPGGRGRRGGSGSSSSRARPRARRCGAKRQFGSVPRSRWTGTAARPRASRSASRPAPAKARARRRPAAFRTPRPVQRHGPVDVVGERDREAGAAPARRLEPEAGAQPLQRRVERVERRRRRPESGRGGRAPRLAPRAWPGARTPRRARLPRGALRARPAPRPRRRTGHLAELRGRGRRACRAPSGREASRSRGRTPPHAIVSCQCRVGSLQPRTARGDAPAGRGTARSPTSTEATGAPTRRCRPRPSSSSAPRAPAARSCTS